MPAHPRGRGRPVGLLLNPDAARVLLGNRSQAWWSNAADISTAHLSEMMAGSKGATLDAAHRLANVLGDDVPVGALFPELAQFRTKVRHFVAPTFDEDAA